MTRGPLTSMSADHPPSGAPTFPRFSRRARPPPGNSTDTIPHFLRSHRKGSGSSFSLQTFPPEQLLSQPSFQRPLTSSSPWRAINSCPCGRGCTPCQIHCPGLTALTATSKTSCILTCAAPNSRANRVTVAPIPSFWARVTSAAFVRPEGSLPQKVQPDQLGTRPSFPFFARSLAVALEQFLPITLLGLQEGEHPARLPSVFR